MKAQWKTVLVKMTTWLAAEIILNLIGLDSLADYSEFLYGQEVVAMSHIQQPTMVVSLL
ncbi:MAG TPA: hypothetical protein V6D14_31050 [Coleofasciculaceae cyanobacterium]|jgi:hypothetical protein